MEAYLQLNYTFCRELPALAFDKLLFLNFCHLSVLICLRPTQLLRGYYSFITCFSDFRM